MFVIRRDGKSIFPKLLEEFWRKKAQPKKEQNMIIILNEEELMYRYYINQKNKSPRNIYCKNCEWSLCNFEIEENKNTCWECKCKEIKKENTV